MNDKKQLLARAFVSSIELPPAPSAPRGAREMQKEEVVFDPLKTQATVTGSEVVSFARGVSAERRQDIVNAALLAQLAATKKVQDKSDVFAWYQAYFDVLGNIGWLIQDTGFNSYEEQADGLEAHEAILKVAALVLGPASTALALVTATVEAMKSMDEDNPWITIFDRESRSAESARFQVALAEEAENGQLMVTTMAFGLRADSSVTQILFFKIHKNKVSFKNCTGKATIDEDVLSDVRADIKKKLSAHIAANIAAIDI